MKVAILTPTARDPKWGYIQSMGAMEEYIRTRGVCGMATDRMTRIVSKQCSLLPQGRQDVLNVALDNHFTHALWIDDDMEFPPDIVDLLYVRSASAIGVNYLRKSRHPEYTAVKDGKIVCSDPPAAGITPVDSCGLGIFLLKLDAIRHIPRPHFEIRWDEKSQDYVAEDVYFMRKLREYGVQPYIDHDLSRQCAHIGDYEYGYAHRKMMEAR